MKIKEKLMKGVFLLASTVSILAVALICIFLFANGIPAIRKSVSLILYWERAGSL